MFNIDDYIKKVIEVGDDGSKLLAAKTASTLKNSKFVSILQKGMNGIAVLRIPDEYYVVVHSSGGNPDTHDLNNYAISMVDNLVTQANLIGATPIAFANVIDSNTGDLSMLEQIASRLVSAANGHKLAILNGENAILGQRVNAEIKANVSGTMISIIKKDELENKLNSSFSVKGNNYFVFDHKGKAIYINSDGVGTKTEFYERTKKYWRALKDALAMKVDDAIKIGAEVVVVSDVVETKGKIPMKKLHKHAKKLSKKFKFGYILQHEKVGKRIQGYNDFKPSYNISGSCVSLIDEKRFKNPLKPKAEEYLIAISGEPNPRSNGITAKRTLTEKILGEDYHKTKIGKLFLKYLARPSEVLYPIFKDLVDNNLVTSVYHMSGGAFNGKLARPLAKHNLFVSIDDLLPPDWRELTLAGASFTSAEKAYSSWPMGNDGFITTNNPEEAIEMIQRYGLKAKVVGTLKKAVKGKTGVELKAYNGEKVYYSGR